MDRRLANDLDNYITGHYGEDQFKDEPLDPQVGDGATVHIGSDSYAATIVKVTRCYVHVQRDKDTRTDRNGQSESQTYTYERNPAATVERFFLNKRGCYTRDSCYYLTVGVRRTYMDPGF